MSSKPELLVAPCSYQAAKYAVEKWHYSGSMPAGKTVKFGAWEDERYIGCVIFSRGGNNRLYSQFNLAQDEGCELTRVALSGHQVHTSRIVSKAVKGLKAQSPGLRLVVSYADEQQQGHRGGIYQAMNWLYIGKSQAQRGVVINGVIVHKRTANSLYGTIKGLRKSDVLWKHKYLYPLDRAMRKQIEPLAQPYPKSE